MEGTVRLARNDDIAVLEEWLKAQQCEGVDDSLYVNWRLTMEAAQEGRLVVYEDEMGDLPAYYWGPINSLSGILEVRRDRRRQGIGRAIVKNQIEHAIREHEPLCYVSCAPQESQVFWESMGFIFPAALNHSFRDPVGIRILDIPLDLPEGESCDVVVRFVDEDRLYDPDGAGKTFAEYSPAAVLASNGMIYLDRVVAFFNPGVIEEKGNLTIELLVDGRHVLLSKAKNDLALAAGVHPCKLGFAIEQIKLDV